MDKKLKLKNVLNNKKLERREMNAVQGGKTCGCGCCGSSSREDNALANYDNGGKSTGLTSPDCEILDILSDD